MRDFNVTTVSVPSGALTIDRREAAARLRTPVDYKSGIVSDCEAELKAALKCRYAYIKTPVKFSGENAVDIGFGAIKSRDLSRALGGCLEAYILGATVGIEADRLLARLEIISPAKYFITDALASAAAESLCEYADRALRGEGKKPMRFSPGYGDLPLEIQPQILESLNAARTLGITLSASLLMKPVKSVTAVMGIKRSSQ